MNESSSLDPRRREDGPVLWPRIVMIGCLLYVLIAILLGPRGSKSPDPAGTTNETSSGRADSDASTGSPLPRGRMFAVKSPAPAQTAEEIVASKVSQYARSRREVVNRMARHYKVKVPEDVKAFFDAVEANRWDELHALFKSISARHQAIPPDREVDAIWPAILDTFGAAQQAHDWPAQKFLDYGQAVLDSLRPGMVYLGGTDSGRWVPALMNTSEGERHVVITQNALMDERYLEYIGFLYGDRLGTLVPDDARAARQAYLDDARKRLEHDQQFPDEPRQVRPGENIRFSDGAGETGFGDGQVQASGMNSVMAVNEFLLQRLLQKNPDLAFAFEESYPMKSMFPEATTAGPIMELRVSEEQSALTRERAAQSVEYWRAMTQQLMADPDFTQSHHARASYSKLVSSQAGLLLERNFPAEAEQAFRFANELCPSSPEAVYRYVNWLVAQSRIQDALPVAEAAVRADVNHQHQYRGLVAELRRMSAR